MTAATKDTSAREAAEQHLAQMGNAGLRRGAPRKRRKISDARRWNQDYAIFMMDPRGQILSWNAVPNEFKGYRADQIIGRTFLLLSPGRYPAWQAGGDTPDDCRKRRPKSKACVCEKTGHDS